MGRLSRTKGKVFERWVAAQFREAYPFLAGVRRSQQGGGAEQADVTGVPGLWIECQDAARPTPLAKLTQAEGDLEALGLEGRGLFPVAVVHRSGSPRYSTQVYLRLSAVWHLSGWGRDPSAPTAKIVVSMSLESFLALATTYVLTMDRFETKESSR